MQARPNRRHFLVGLSAAGAAGVFGARGSLADEEPPETTTIRLSKVPGVCIAPQYAAEELLRAEGFTDVRYIETEPGLGPSRSVARGELDFILNFAPLLVIPMAASRSITVLAGVHSGCFELFANERIRRILDLKGKSVGVQALGSTPHVFLAVMARYVGLDPVNDINWVTSPSIRPKELFAEGKTDAFLGFPPEPQELRARHIGHVILNSAADRPWSQYFCCMLAGSRSFIDQHPIATKRVVRAILKATDLCVAEPERVAQRGRWRVCAAIRLRAPVAHRGPLRNMAGVRPGGHDPVLRATAARGGHDRVDPQKILAQGTDWRFLNELKRELKA